MQRIWRSRRRFHPIGLDPKISHVSIDLNRNYATYQTPLCLQNLWRSSSLQADLLLKNLQHLWQPWLWGSVPWEEWGASNLCKAGELLSDSYSWGSFSTRRVIKVSVWVDVAHHTPSFLVYFSVLIFSLLFVIVWKGYWSLMWHTWEAGECQPFTRPLVIHSLWITRPDPSVASPPSPCRPH